MNRGGPADNLRERLLRMDNGISQDDLNALFQDIQVETTKPKLTEEIKDMEALDGSETLSQDQIDELLKAFLND
ncbi:MAG TPA: hypothetical protein VHO84_02265 [Syntrophorhabdaceae bacterium]|nr:hypothetical protein [Syntrophorhabdaceae bacterium]